ncbi:MAG: hypothetical protein OEV64_10485, partial [Desulfobulbaceae bacterium]|nr:hypothetical protein [Desulfobulbaceae bacterium]
MNMKTLLPSTLRSFQDQASLPVELSLGLKTWFPDDILQQGLSLLRNREIQHFISFRQGVGVVFNKEAFAGLMFERSDKAHSG